MPRPPQTASVSPPMSRGRARRIASRHVGMALLLSAVMVLGGGSCSTSGRKCAWWAWAIATEAPGPADAGGAQKELQVELSSLRQLRRIEDIAAQHLGLRPPQATQVIYVRSGQQAVGQRRP